MRHEEGNKADYCPPERSLVLGWGGGHKKSATPCMNGWMADWLHGWVLGPRLAGWLACLPTEKACKGTREGLGNVRHDIETKPTTVPRREALFWAAGHKESA